MQKGLEIWKLQTVYRSGKIPSAPLKNEFLTNLKSLNYLQIEGLKNIDTYEPILNCPSLETFLAYNCKPTDKSLKGLVNVKNIGLGDSYSKEEIQKLVANFTGDTIGIRAKEIKGKLNYINQFDTIQQN